MVPHILLSIKLLVILVFFSAFFSGSETALFSLSKIRVKRLQLENRRNSKLVAGLLDRPTRLLVSILIGNMFVNTLASSTASVLITSRFGNDALAFSIALMTLIILIFGEITPKSIAIHNAEGFSLAVAPYINAFSKFVFPIRRLIRFITDFLVAEFAKRFKLETQSALTEEGLLKEAIGLGRKEGVLDIEEEKMFKGIFEFGDKTAKDAMKPRKSIIAFEAASPLEKIKQAIRKKELARIPIYAGELDNILGILYTRDLVKAAANPALDIKEILRKPLYVSQDTKLDDLMRELRVKRVHMAIVKDGTKVAGLVTLQDLLEEIIGEMKDTKKEAAL